MILALDVHYREKEAKAVGILFNWEDTEPKEIIVEYINEVEEYIPGEFYKRELPCLLKIIEKVNLKDLEAIIIDGYIYVDNKRKLGLGGMLWENLDKQIPIIGIAKTSFYSNKETVQEIFRGESKNALYISTINYDIEIAIEKINKMSGSYRIPTLLKELDRITKEQ